MADLGRLRDSMLEIGRRIHQQGLNRSLDGNLSVRVGPDRYLLTCSLVNKGFLTAADLPLVDGLGRLLDGQRAPSSEYRLHLRIYEARPEVGAIIHAHAPWATACTLAGLDLTRLVLTESPYFVGPVPTAALETPGTEAFARAAVTALGSAKALLLERHGCVTLGADLEEAYQRLEGLEHVASILFRCRDLNLPEIVGAQREALKAELLRRGLPWEYK